MPSRRQFLATAAALGALPHLRAEERFSLDELTIADLQAKLERGELSAVSLVKLYSARIAEIDAAGPLLRSVIEMNPEAADIAKELDAERKAKKSRGPLHCIPVLLKDNIDTADKMATTAGSLALVGAKPAKDSPLVVKLRNAGAVILGKTNLSEWANFRSSRSTSGWSGRGGLTKNPYELSRNPSGSSSGSAVAVAANLCAGAIGTETDGSIVSPSNCCGIVGVKPTLGLISRSGIIPIAHSQDTAGPMTRTVRDAAILLTAMAGSDPNDPATADANKHAMDYAATLKANSLTGARLGIARQFFGFNETVDQLMADALGVLKKQGATLIDLGDEDRLERYGAAEITVMLYEFKHNLNAYLAKLGPAAPVKSLADVIEFNKQNADKEMPYFGQELFLRAEACGPLTDQIYRDSLEKCRRLSRTDGIDAIMDRHKLDAIVAPTGGPAGKTNLKDGPERSGGGGCSSPAAVAGYPHITVPNGFVGNLPVGISFFGRAWSEAKLLSLAYAYEQATRLRRPPRFLE